MKKTQLQGSLSQLSIYIRQEVSVWCELLIRPRRFTSYHTVGSSLQSLHFQQQMHLTGGCSQGTGKHQINPPAPSYTSHGHWLFTNLPSQSRSHLTAAVVNLTVIVLQYSTISRMFLLGLERFVQHKHFLFPEQRSFGSKALM